MKLYSRFTILLTSILFTLVTNAANAEETTENKNLVTKFCYAQQTMPVCNGLNIQLDTEGKI